MVHNLRQNLLGGNGDILKLEIDPKSHSAWTENKLLDKVE